MQTDVLIIGGGIAGLTSAMGLRESGLRVTVVERGERLGGRAQSWVDPESGDAVDIGPHILLSEYRNFLALLRMLGTEGDVVWQKDEFITFVEARKRMTMYMHRLPAPLHLMPSLLSVPTLSKRDVMSNMRPTWIAMRMTDEDALRLDRLDAESYLRRLGVTQRFIDWYWKTLSMAILNVPLSRCSAGALLRFFREMITHSGYHIGFPGRGLGELFAPGAARLIEAAGGDILLKCDVRGLITTADGVAGAVLADGTRIDARFCVAAIPPQDLQRLLPNAWLRQYREFSMLGEFQPSPYVSTYIWFSRKVTRKRFWARIWSPRDLSTDSYDLSNIRPDWRDRPSLIATNIIYSNRNGIPDMSDSEILEATLRELADFTPEATRARVVRGLVNRIPMAKPCPYPGIEHRRPDPRPAVRNLVLAGDWTRTGLPMSMESAAYSGWRAAEEVWAMLEQPRSLTLPVRPPQGFTKLTMPREASITRRAS